MDFTFVVNNLNWGGAQRNVLRLCELLRARGHDVRVVLLRGRVVLAPPPGLDVHALFPARGGLVERFLGRRANAVVAARRLRALLRRLGVFDRTTVVSTLTDADEVVSLARLPRARHRIANTLSAEIAAFRERDPRRAARRLARYRRTYEGADLIAVSDGVAEDLRSGLGLRPRSVLRIYNGYDYAAIRAAASAAEPDLPTVPFVLHVARFVAQKRHDLLFDAWRLAEVPHVLVLLVDPSPGLESLATRYGVRDRILVAGTRANPYPWMRAAEAVVLCSDREGMPNVLVEALACGTRVVSTDCPSGPREILRGPLARGLVPTGDARALAAALRDVLQSPRPGPDAAPPEFAADVVAAAYEALGRAAT